MAKRFTDTDKWDRPWFRNLHWKYKLLWMFILDKCDIAGVYYVDLEMASFQMGIKFDREDAEKALEKQIEKKADRWLIRDFIAFQYGVLNESNKIYKNVTAKLSGFKEGAFIPHQSPIYGVKDKEKDKEKDKVGLVPCLNATNIPEDLKDNEADIKDWIQNKKELGFTYKPTGLNSLWGMIRRIPPEKRHESIQFSIASGWKGIYEKNGGSNGKQGTYGGSIGEIGKSEGEGSKFAGIVRTIKVGTD